ncbi:hypothetical protein PMAC_001407 [Pneumocystis sp. 'macacae']|nr:hypothetical protein PMAC_001407 [Pneumocystis sp. 'macacae']
MENSSEDGIALTVMATEKEIGEDKGNKTVQNGLEESGFEGGMLRPRKQRTKWTIEETNDLLHGCSTYGVGNWKKILHDSRYRFNNRSPIDLKDRFRTVFPQDYRYFYPNAHTHTNRQQKMASQSFLPRVNRKERRAFTPDEDARLLEGFMRVNGIIQVLDVTFSLSSRRSIDLRDRFRNAFPEKYAAAGFKSRPSKSTRKQATRSAPMDTSLSVSSQPYNNTSTPLEIKSWQSYTNVGDMCNMQSMVFGENIHSVPNTSLESFQEIFSTNTFNTYDSSNDLFISSEPAGYGHKSSMEFVVPQNSNVLWSNINNHNILPVNSDKVEDVSSSRYVNHMSIKTDVLPPKGTLVAVTSTVYVSPTFIIHHFIRTSIQNNRAVVLVSFVNDFQELVFLSKKWGFDFASKTSSEKLVYVDGLTRLYGHLPDNEFRKYGIFPVIRVNLLGESNLDDIFSAIQSGIDQVSSLGEMPSLILWGADFLVASEILTPPDILSMISMVHHCIVTFNVDFAFLSPKKRLSELEVNYSIFVHAIIYQSHSIISLRQLPSGRAKEVTGIIRLSRGSGYYATQEDIEECVSGIKESESTQFEMLYWVHDLGVRVFPKGLSF